MPRAILLPNVQNPAEAFVETVYFHWNLTCIDHGPASRSCLLNSNFEEYQTIRMASICCLAKSRFANNLLASAAESASCSLSRSNNFQICKPLGAHFLSNSPCKNEHFTKHERNRTLFGASISDASLGHYPDVHAVWKLAPVFWKAMTS